MDRKKFAEVLCKPLIPRKCEMPKGTACRNCGSDNLARSVVPVGGPFSGHVWCNSCGHSETVMSHIAENIVSVQPLDDPKRSTS